MIDCLVSADLSVEDPESVATVLVSALGLPPWRPSWVHDWAPSAYRAYFLRPQLNRAAAPTAIEVIGPHPEGGWSPQLRKIHEMQGDRPMKTHNSVFSVPDVETYVERLTKAAVPFRYDPGNENLPFGKLWVGLSGEDEDISYSPDFDAGLFIELVPTASLRLPTEADLPAGEAGVDEGGVVRAASRSFIVDDLDSTVRTLEELMGWPAPPVETLRLDQCRVATYRPANSASATFELLEAQTSDSPIGEHRARFGAGAYRITFAVNGLQAASEALNQRGVDHAIQSGDDRNRLHVDPPALGGLIIDLVDHTESP